MRGHAPNPRVKTAVATQAKLPLTSVAFIECGQRAFVLALSLSPHVLK